MLDAFSAVIVYSDGSDADPTVVNEPAYVCIAHNLLKWDATRLAERLRRDYDLPAHVVYHRNHHTESKAQDCDLCQVLFEEIVERASKVMGETRIVVAQEGK